ncbi:Leucine-rich repeat [Dillenia turbinata]|uniref:Leucine-rich repeat n=1 Tax=Dillenia turbinata TaxID=194707 RepID=A0AAN8ZT01_9MAGN
MFDFLCLMIHLLTVSNARILQDRASLLSFMAGIEADPQNVLANWNSSAVHVCEWSGVKCSNNSGRVEELVLSGMSLRGTISPSLGNLSYLTILDLSENFFHGKIPMEIGSLFELKQLSLSSNLLEGKIPSQMGKLNDGELPTEIVHKTPQLQFLYLSYNNFESHDYNTNLEPFFASLANSSNLQELELAGNNLRGEIPPIIGNLSTKLAQLHLDDNQLYGPIPPDISNLVNLTLLNLSSNLLNGSIPQELCRLRRLERLYLTNNSLSGEIPSAFGDMPHLGLLDLSRNDLSGSIPDSFANLSQLRRLLLYENELSGTIPPSLGKCINLEILDLSYNKISGMIPSEVAGLGSLKLYLNFSSNQLQGPIPLELSKMDMVLAIDLSLNNLSGAIPSQLGSCIALEYLNLSGNSFQGPLPVTVGRLPYLKVLDVSSNQLNGQIPISLQASSTLKQLNFSFNNFSGNISDKGAFSSLTISSFLGNKGLCGSIKGMQHCHKKRGYQHIILPILLSVCALILLCIFGYSLLRKSKIRRPLEIFATADSEDGEREQKELSPSFVIFFVSFLYFQTEHFEFTGFHDAEYGMGKRASTHGDVYSFGILLLEIVTGKRPTDVLLHEGSCLHEWVKSHFPHNLEPIVEQALLSYIVPATSAYYSKLWHDIIIELVELGLMCTQYAPSTRPTMLDVAQEMGRLKQYLSSPPSLGHDEDSSKVFIF